ncbi:MAG: rhomboid family intramembrane serine protease [Bacteroidota bacterium]
MTNEIQHNNNSYFTIPLYFVLLLWLVKWAEYKFGLDLAVFGVKPQSFSGLRGVIFSPFLHGDTTHLFNNSIPVFLLSMALFYFYKPIAWRVLIFSWVISGMLTWFIGRGNSYHIGASGVIYALASFLFFSGVIRKHPKLMAISLIVTFLYGSMVWGIFPNKVEVSWEGHLSGALVGLLLAIVFRKIGPRKKSYHWEDEERELTEHEKYLEDLALKAGEEEDERQKIKDERQKIKDEGQKRKVYPEHSRRDKIEEEVKNIPDKLSHKPVKYHYKPKKEE